MCKLIVVVTRFLSLCAVLLALPTIADAQCISKLTVQRVWTQDAAGTDKPTFAPGEPIRYAAQLNNSYGGWLLAANGTQLTITTMLNTATNTNPVDIPPGISPWTWDATAPSEEGSYIVTVKAYDHFCGVWVERSSSFTIGQSTGMTVTLERSLTHNGDGDFGQEQSAFTTGEVIRYAAIINNLDSSTVNPRFDFQVTGPRELFSWTGDVPISPGRWRFHFHTTVPPDAPVGTYTLRVTMTYNGKISIQESSFTVTLYELPVSRTPEGKAPNLVVLVHGCCTDANDVRNDWENGLGRKIAETIQIPGTWEIVVWDWTRCTADPNVECTLKPPGPVDWLAIKQYGDIAYQYASSEGPKLADAINQHSIYEYIHLIAHSAGSNLIDKAAKKLAVDKNLQNAERPFIHLTFLDAYTPSWDDAKNKYGSLPNNYLEHYSEHYVDKGFPLSDTDEALPHAFNFDITNWTPTARDLSGHQWPRYWYEESITSPGFAYGYLLSFEGGNDLFRDLARQFRAGECIKLNSISQIAPCN